MRDEKEERKKQARSNKQTRQSNTAHPRQSLFLEKMSCLGWDSTHDILYSRQSALPTELPRQLSWLGPNVTSHSTPDEQANHQLSMKEKAGVMKPPMTPNTYKYLHVDLWHQRTQSTAEWSCHTVSLQVFAACGGGTIH